MKEIVDESEYLRVTTPLSKYSNYDKVPLPILNYASDRGTRVHIYCELYALNMLFGEIDSDCFEYVQAFVNWFDENVNEVKYAEKRLYCEKWKIQGQIDLICNLKNQEPDKYHLIDLKTSLNYSKTWPLQMAAYKYLCLENDIPIQDRVIIHLHKDSTFDVIESKDQENQYKYLNELNIYSAILEAHRYFS